MSDTSCSQLESECSALRQSRDSLEGSKAALEQRCHELNQQLKISTLAVRELEGSQDRSGELERQAQALRGQWEEAEKRVTVLEKVSVGARCKHWGDS